MSKRDKGDGMGPRQRVDGRWEARYTDLTGKRRTIYGKSRSAVSQELRTRLRERDQGIAAAQDERLTVRDYLVSWLETIKPRVRYETWMRHGRDVRIHLVPALGHIRLAKLTPRQVQEFYTAKIADGLAPSTIRRMHVVLHSALKSAWRLGLVQRNVTELVDAPHAELPEIHTWTADEALAFLDAARGNRLEALYVLVLSTGLRRGEALGLRWADVTLQGAEPTVRITNTLQWRAEGEWRLEEPKTKASRRAIALPPMAVEALRQHRARQVEQRLAAADWQEHDLVFTTATGSPLRPESLVTEHFQPLMRTAGVTRIRFHDLRHTAATLLLAQHVEAVIVSKLLGHSSVEFTLNRYVHPTAQMQRLAASAMERLLGTRSATGNSGSFSDSSSGQVGGQTDGTGNGTEGMRG